MGLEIFGLRMPVLALGFAGLGVQCTGLAQGWGPRVLTYDFIKPYRTPKRAAQNPPNPGKHRKTPKALKLDLSVWVPVTAESRAPRPPDPHAIATALGGLSQVINTLIGRKHNPSL